MGAEIRKWLRWVELFLRIENHRWVGQVFRPSFAFPFFGSSTSPGAQVPPGLATFETRVRKEPSLWESRQVQELQFLFIP